MKSVMAVWISVLALLVAGCGGDSSSSSSNKEDETPVELTNVALAANGGEAWASYDGGNAHLVNDGEQAGQFWAGNVQYDEIEVVFDQPYQIRELTIYTNRTNNSDLSLWLSAGDDDTVFDQVVLFSDCATLQMGSGRIHCVLKEERLSQVFNVEIEASTDVSSIQIYEMEAWGY